MHGRHFQVRIPGGASYEDLRLRVSSAWATIGAEQRARDIAVIAHGGVIRSILAGITGTSLAENEAPPEREQHKPKSFYR